MSDRDVGEVTAAVVRLQHGFRAMVEAAEVAAVNLLREAQRLKGASGLQFDRLPPDARTWLVESAVAAERERCAQIAEVSASTSTPGPYREACENIAGRIRVAPGRRVA